MKTKLLGILTSLSLLISFACEKDKICLEGGPCSSTVYMPLAVGNYWVYEVQNYNFNTYAIFVNPLPDSIIVSGDTMIRNKKYFIVEIDRWAINNNLRDTTYLRDSVGYLINQLGNIQFASSDFDRPLNREDILSGAPGDQYVEYSIRDSTIVQITPQGVFNCLDYSGKVWSGLVWNDRKFHNCYAKEVGLVYQSAYFTSSSPSFELRRLLKEYHLE